MQIRSLPSEPSNPLSFEESRESDANTQAARDVKSLRHTVLEAVLKVAVVLGGVAALVAIQLSYQEGAPILAMVIIPSYAMVLFCTFARGLSFETRAFLFQAGLFAVGFASLVSVGFLAGPALLLLVQVVLSALFFNRRMIALSLAAGVLSFVVVGALMSTGLISVETTLMYRPNEFTHWLRIAIIFLFVASISVVSVYYLVHVLQSALSRRDRLVNALGRQIDARDEAERRRILAESQLRHSQKMEALGRLAGGVAHDFNNTLTVILGHTELLLHKTRDQPALRSIASGIEDAARNSVDLTRQLLTFGHRRPLQPRSHDPADLIAQAERLLRRVLPDGVSLNVVLPTGLPPVIVDRGDFQQTMLNLAINAFDAMNGGGELRLEVSVETSVEQEEGTLPQDFVAFHVIDTGEGMSEDVAAHAFEPFFTTKDIERGTGLGLAAVDAFARASHGFTSLKSQLGHGTRISFYLPAAEFASEDLHSTSMVVSKVGSASVLVVEDDDMIRSILCETLRGQGYRVSEAPDGDVAADFVRNPSNSIDLVLTDAVMPGVDGGALVELLRDLRPETRIVVCSGYVEPDGLRPLIRSGEVTFLRKPFRRFEVLDVVQDALRKTPTPVQEEVTARVVLH